MERDFMGLTVKQETPDETMDSGPSRSSPMQWSFSNKVSAVPQLLSFQGAQKEKLKTGFDSLASTGLVTITTTAEAFNSDLKPYSGVMQKNIFPENRGGLHYTVTPYPAQNQLSNPVPAFPPSSFIADTAGLRNASKTLGAPTQLTIFYSGSVCVYDNVSPEKAQAIMLLAGNVSPSQTKVSGTPIQAPVTPSPAVDGFAVNKLTSTNVPQSAEGLGSNNGPTVMKPGRVGETRDKVEPLKVVNMIGSVPATFLSSGAVPQARRKSLVRFLEKRKERTIDSSPYPSKKPLECSSPISTSINTDSSEINILGSENIPTPAYQTSVRVPQVVGPTSVSHVDLVRALIS